MAYQRGEHGQYRCGKRSRRQRKGQSLTHRGQRQALTASRTDGTARRQERVSFVERVRQQMRQRQGVGTDADFEQHEAHLRTGRPGQRVLDRRLGQHRHDGHQSRETTHGDEQIVPQRQAIEDWK